MICIYTETLSPHQLPLAKELAARVRRGQFVYVHRQGLQKEREMMGWSLGVIPRWVVQQSNSGRMVEEVDTLLTGIRDVELFERRAKSGLKTFYMSERWLKPVTISRFFGFISFSIPGWVRLLIPGYRRMLKKFIQWIKSDSNGRVFAIGPWAKKDMMRLGVPESKIVPWGYFVAPSAYGLSSRRQSGDFSSSFSTLSVLWVGRMLSWKCVDTIVRAVREVRKSNRKIHLTLVGDGPEKARLQRMVVRGELQCMVSFLPSQPIGTIREIMRENDVYVLSSNAQEGWGAALSEALEEWMACLGTYEAGSSAAMLDDDSLFHAGDWRTLARKLADLFKEKVQGRLCGQGIGEWSAHRAAERILDFSE